MVNVAGFSGRVHTLHHSVYAFLRGESPEGIADSFPALNLEQIFGALAFHMANRDDVDPYLREGQAESEAQRKEARKADPAFYPKIAGASRGSLAPPA